MSQNTDGWRAVTSSWAGNAIVIERICQCHAGRRCRGIFSSQHPHHISPQVARSFHRRRRGWSEVVVELINFIRHNFGFYRSVLSESWERKTFYLIGNFLINKQSLGVPQCKFLSFIVGVKWPLFCCKTQNWHTNRKKRKWWGENCFPNSIKYFYV